MLERNLVIEPQSRHEVLSTYLPSYRSAVADLATSPEGLPIAARSSQESGNIRDEL